MLLLSYKLYICIILTLSIQYIYIYISLVFSPCNRTTCTCPPSDRHVPRKSTEFPAGFCCRRCSRGRFRRRIPAAVGVADAVEHTDRRPSSRSSVQWPANLTSRHRRRPLIRRIWARNSRPPGCCSPRIPRRSNCRHSPCPEAASADTASASNRLGPSVTRSYYWPR